MTVEISVVMANYNGARYLGAALKSVQGQTFPHWELIFVDDGSDDDSVTLVSRAASHDSRIRVLVQKSNQGPAAARNKAIELAKGRWIAVFDSDDLMRPDRLDVLRERAKSDRAAIVADNLLVFSADQPNPKYFLPHDYTRAPRWVGLAEYIDSNRLYSRTPDLGYLKPMIDLERLRASGIRYDERLRVGEDYELIARLMAAGMRLRLEPTAHYLYRKHASSISHRIHAEALEALIEANNRLQLAVRPLDTEILEALRRRDQSLQAMLAYDRVIGMLKAGDYARAAQVSIREPRIWPLLTRPVTARMSRLAKAMRPSRTPLLPPASPAVH
jgi:succinoglycan biosynthesis protein ExoO